MFFCYSWSYLIYYNQYYIYMYIHKKYVFTYLHTFSLVLDWHTSQHKTTCQRMWRFSIVQNNKKLDLMIQLSMVNPLVVRTKYALTNHTYCRIYITKWFHQLHQCYMLTDIIQNTKTIFFFHFSNSEICVVIAFAATNYYETTK